MNQANLGALVAGATGAPGRSRAVDRATLQTEEDWLRVREKAHPPGRRRKQ
jgi:hypothetical protein